MHCEKIDSPSKVRQSESFCENAVSGYVWINRIFDETLYHKGYNSMPFTKIS
jgi:hypothetical protein